MIGQSSRQLKKCDSVQEQSGFLCKRSSAFARLATLRSHTNQGMACNTKCKSNYHLHCRLSRHLRAIPAAQSERQALSGLDPFHLAHLALNDACKAAELAPTASAYELQVYEPL